MTSRGKRLVRSFAILVPACGWLATAPRVSAEPFRWTVTGGATHTENAPDSKIDGTALAAAYYFGGVEDSGGPLALASFRNPTTRLWAELGRERMVERSSFSVVGNPTLRPEFATETDRYTIGGRHVLPNAKWYYGGRYSNDDIDNFASSSTLSDSKSYGLFGGRYLGANTTLDVTLDRAAGSTEGRGVACDVNFQLCVAIIPQTTRTTTDRASLKVLHVRHFRALTYTLAGEVEGTSAGTVLRLGAFQSVSPLPPVVFGPGVTVPARTIEFSLPRFRTYSVGAEFFPTARLGVRLGYLRWDGVAPTDDAYDIATTWFATRNVGLRFSIARQRWPTGFPDRTTDSGAVQVTGRF